MVAGQRLVFAGVLRLLLHERSETELCRKASEVAVVLLPERRGFPRRPFGSRLAGDDLCALSTGGGGVPGVGPDLLGCGEAGTLAPSEGMDPRRLVVLCVGKILIGSTVEDDPT